MDDYSALIKNIAVYNNQDDIYRLRDVFLAFTDDYIKNFSDKGVPDEDLRQECALVISEYFAGTTFLEIDGRRERILVSNENNDLPDNTDNVLKEIIRDVSASCEKALVNLTETEERMQKAGMEVLAKVNLINEGTQRFISEYGIKPTPAELSEFLDIDEDTIIEAVELSGYEIKDIDFDTPVREQKT